MLGLSSCLKCPWRKETIVLPEVTYRAYHLAQVAYRDYHLASSGVQRLSSCLRWRTDTIILPQVAYRDYHLASSGVQRLSSCLKWRAETLSSCRKWRTETISSCLKWRTETIIMPQGANGDYHLASGGVQRLSSWLK